MHHLVIGLAVFVQLQAPTPPAAPVTTTTTTTTAPTTTTTPTTTTPTTPTTTPPAADATAVPPTDTVIATPIEPPPVVEKKSLLPQKTKPRLLVMDLIDKGAGLEVTNAMSQAIQAQAVLSHAGETITTTQIKLLLDAQANQQLTGCDSELCMTDIGKLIEADLILGGNAAKVGDDVVVTLLTVNPADGKRVKQEQRKTPINRDLYYYAAKEMTSLVLTGKGVDPRVPVIVSVVDGSKSTPVEGAIVVDGKQISAGSTAQLTLEPGKHEIIVKSSGFADWKTVVDVQEASPLTISATLVSERIFLWPVAIGTGAAAVVFGVVGALMADYARGEFDGSSALFNTDKDKNYSAIVPTNSADLCQREQNISFYAGRAPSADGKEAFGTPNECGIAAGPGLIHYTLITSGVLLLATGALVTTDLVLGAE
jgi:hypothetical protein